jgi:RNA polymerase sigma-70 factor, ECF subfamily
MNDDLRIIQQVLGGDVDAFRLLVERYQGPLFALVGNLVRDRGDCDDIAQETFLAAYLHLGSYDPRQGRFSTWLLTIARNKCLNGIKKRRPQAMEVLPPPIDPRGPADALIEAELFGQLDRALAALPFEQRSAFVLSELQGLSHEEICRIESAPLGTIKSRISRAKEKLRSLLPRASEQH